MRNEKITDIVFDNRNDAMNVLDFVVEKLERLVKKHGYFTEVDVKEALGEAAFTDIKGYFVDLKNEFETTDIFVIKRIHHGYIIDFK